jgi:hypothetical protein
VKIPGMSSISSLSCASAGNCSAGGSYFAAHFHAQGFVVSQHNGSWGKATQIPGLVALSNGGSAFVLSVSCATAGTCSAGGYYVSASFPDRGFVLSQHNGTWGKATQVPGLAALSNGGSAFVLSVSCAMAGTCSAGGFYATRHGHAQAFVVNQNNRTWGNAQKVPGTAALNAGRNAATNTELGCLLLSGLRILIAA